VRDEISSWLLPHFAGKDLLFITLTCWCRVGKDALSRGVAKLIHRTKRRVLGRKSEHIELAAVVILEQTYKGGVHAHLILEDPFSLPCLKAFPCTVPIATLITEEWARLGLGGSDAAQDVQRVYDLAGAMRYLQKTIGGASVLDRLDLNNLCLPNRSGS
jgi:hypothetical protein